MPPPKALGGAGLRRRGILVVGAPRADPARVAVLAVARTDTDVVRQRASACRRYDQHAHAETLRTSPWLLTERAPPMRLRPRRGRRSRPAVLSIKSIAAHGLSGSRLDAMDGGHVSEITRSVDLDPAETGRESKLLAQDGRPPAPPDRRRPSPTPRRRATYPADQAHSVDVQPATTLLRFAHWARPQATIYSSTPCLPHLHEAQQGATYDDLLAVARTAEELSASSVLPFGPYLRMATARRTGPTDAWITLAAWRGETCDCGLDACHVRALSFRLPEPLAISWRQLTPWSRGASSSGSSPAGSTTASLAHGHPVPVDAGAVSTARGVQLAIITACGPTPSWRST